MSKNPDLMFGISQIIKREKMAEGGFKYICDKCEFACLGRKKIINHMKEKHADNISEIQEQYEADGNKDFEAQLSKIVMNVPFCEKDAKRLENEPNKDYPMTLDFMKIIDNRTSMIPKFGGLLGRLARLLAMVVSKEEPEDSVSVEVTKLSCLKCKIIIGKETELYDHLENYHGNFIQNLNSMFPLAANRMEQFLQLASTEFELVVPTGNLIHSNQSPEKKINFKRKNIGVKNDSNLENLKRMKFDKNTVNIEESLRIKKEISVIENALKDPEASEVRKNRLQKKKDELESKLKVKQNEEKEVKYQLKIQNNLNVISPTQLRKLFMEYFDNLESFQTICWKSTLELANIDEDLVFVIGFLETLYDLAKVKRTTGFKVGHILVTSTQAQDIVEKGFRSYRDFVKNDSWRIPDNLNLENSAINLHEDWNLNDDSTLLIGASKFGKNLKKIMNHYPVLMSKSVDSSGTIKHSVKERFDYLLHIYQNRGTFNLGLSNHFYIEDIDEVEMLEEDNDQEEGEV